MDEKMITLLTKEEIKTLATKAILKAGEDKIVKLELHDLSCFRGKNFFGDDDSQNMFVYQPTFIILSLKVSKRSEYVVGWKSKDLYKSKLLPLLGVFLPNIKYFAPKLAIQFINIPLVAEQNNYSIKINWAKILLRNVILKNLLVWHDYCSKK